MLDLFLTASVQGSQAFNVALPIWQIIGASGCSPHGASKSVKTKPFVCRALEVSVDCRPDES